jgi:hypothetical protein
MDYARFGQPIAGQQEVACLAKFEKQWCEWVTAEGVFLPVPGSDDVGESAGADGEL